MSRLYLWITVAWVVLCLATVLSVYVSSTSSTLVLNVAVLAAAFVKVLLVMYSFMELGAASPAWRLAYAGWAVGVCLVLAVLLAGPAA